MASLLQGLRVKELVAPRTPSTLAGAGEWAFHHVLVRDVAYDSLPKADRRLVRSEAMGNRVLAAARNRAPRVNTTPAQC